ncbi:MAG: hypothetical protein HY330_02775, partial [Chloroflexi bacterium]|nr:hypothetical protein [Chloroflexota bacterium]
MISGPPEERALLAAEAAAQTGRVEEAAAALAGTAEQTAAYQAALSLARARWEECRGALGAAQRHALDATGEASGVPALAALAWLAAGRVYLSSGEPKRAHDCLGRAADLIADN